MRVAREDKRKNGDSTSGTNNGMLALFLQAFDKAMSLKINYFVDIA